MSGKRDGHLSTKELAGLLAIAETFAEPCAFCKAPNAETIVTVTIRHARTLDARSIREGVCAECIGRVRELSDASARTMHEEVDARRKTRERAASIVDGDA